MNKMMKAMNMAYLVVAMLALASSCAIKKSPESINSQIVGIKWQLVELEGKPVSERVNDKMPYLQMNKEGNYSASGGCNCIGGTYKLGKNSGIKFSLGVSTMMACPDMSAEHGLQNLLEKAGNYRLKSSDLIFSQGNGNPLAKFSIATD